LRQPTSQTMAHLTHIEIPIRQRPPGTAGAFALTVDDQTFKIKEKRLNKKTKKKIVGNLHQTPGSQHVADVDRKYSL